MWSRAGRDESTRRASPVHSSVTCTPPSRPPPSLWLPDVRNRWFQADVRSGCEPCRALSPVLKSKHRSGSGVRAPDGLATLAAVPQSVVPWMRSYRGNVSGKLSCASRKPVLPTVTASASVCGDSCKWSCFSALRDEIPYQVSATGILWITLVGNLFQARSLEDRNRQGITPRMALKFKPRREYQVF